MLTGSSSVSCIPFSPRFCATAAAAAAATPKRVSERERDLLSIILLPDSSCYTCRIKKALSSHSRLPLSREQQQEKRALRHSLSLSFPYRFEKSVSSFFFFFISIDLCGKEGESCYAEDVSRRGGRRLVTGICVTIADRMDRESRCVRRAIAVRHRRLFFRGTRH